MTAAITCTATTRLTHAECLARLAACPALPRGERLEWALASENRHGNRHQQSGRGTFASWWRRNTPYDFPGLTGNKRFELSRWHRLAAPLRKAREQRQQYRNALIYAVDLHADARIRFLESEVERLKFVLRGPPDTMIGGKP